MKTHTIIEENPCVAFNNSQKFLSLRNRGEVIAKVSLRLFLKRQFDNHNALREVRIMTAEEGKDCGLLERVTKIAASRRREFVPSELEKLRAKFCPGCDGNENNCPIILDAEGKVNGWAKDWKPGRVEVGEVGKDSQTTS
ncbi:MAG: hypothetical protein UT39_C0002G0113 [Candidatus Woesebacteria bacterium GW2011_GWA1_39_21]|uniref:Uncharacterized protein n=1 Tax=Candidatus Woesebacteria bacterium GW2011_GWA1_39_21 TaxID=1618550 RepID=A0A0G0RE35_9BACT|nr:MAG: hypothetical protein UT39_C0002G0113 [Candidatus Woesebacteria bacterium GW2011_GWA1_39_21]